MSRADRLRASTVSFYRGELQLARQEIHWRRSMGFPHSAKAEAEAARKRFKTAVGFLRGLRGSQDG